MGSMGAGLAIAALPTMQQAIVQTGLGGPEVLHLQSVPVLAPRHGEVLVRVFAAAINPADWKSRQSGGDSAALIPGYDVAGRVAALGTGVTTLKLGEAVFGVTGRGDVGGLNGTYAHYVVIPASDLAAKPHNLTYAEASGLGVATLAGVRIVDQAHVQRGERVLITGVAGGVGSAAAQAAIARGAGGDRAWRRRRSRVAPWSSAPLRHVTLPTCAGSGWPRSLTTRAATGRNAPVPRPRRSCSTRWGRIRRVRHLRW
jgi:NADPH:quinone reductase-like Zn-dependent oxidoreductase